jgi:adenosine deaminase
MCNKKYPLLVTTGTSYGVILMAYFLKKEETNAVHIIGTDNTKTNYELLNNFFAEIGIEYTITIIQNYKGIDTPEDHYIYQECLYNWYLSKTTDVLPNICLAGGMKSMSACMYKAAHLFGANNVFHVLNESRTDDPIEIELLIAKQRAVALDLGSEPGWETFKNLWLNNLNKNKIGKKHNGIHYIEQPKLLTLSSNIQDVITRVQVHFSNKVKDEYPFQSILLLPADKLSWLNEVVDPVKDKAWIAALPKVDLHCHLGGFATFNEALNLVKQAAAHPENILNTPTVPLPLNWPYPIEPITLDAYMHLGDANGSALLFDEGCLRKQIQLLYAHFKSENVKYAEVRCSPDNYRTASKSTWDVLQFIIKQFEGCMQLDTDTDICYVNIILIATRKENGDMSSISRHLALAVTAVQHQETILYANKCNIVGVDLAGYESKETRAGYFTADFTGVHRCGLAITAHAGENDNAEGIWEAVYKLNARRLGHALHLIDSNSLMQTVIDRKIGVEMCPLANYQIKGFKPMLHSTKEYPLKKYLDSGVLVSVNTDNIGISGGGITENFLLAVKMCPGLTRMDILQLIKNALEISFNDKALKKQNNALFDRLIYQSIVQLNIES